MPINLKIMRYMCCNAAANVLQRITNLKYDIFHVKGHPNEYFDRLCRSYSYFTHTFWHYGLFQLKCSCNAAANMLQCTKCPAKISNHFFSVYILQKGKVWQTKKLISIILPIKLKIMDYVCCNAATNVLQHINNIE